MPTPSAEKDCGSSPHTRGAPTGHQAGISQSRIIPAYAGSTGNGRGPEIPRRDHPRIRGEHHSRVSESVRQAGSSPHTRGAPGSSSPARRRRGIIPAYAGSTRPWSRSPGGSRDHPRIRGEHLRGGPALGLPLGSSPHTRGARGLARPRLAEHPIIPAYAGSTTGSVGFVTSHWDHPRIRGEHREWARSRNTAAGSSPHTRGAPKTPTGRSPEQPDHPRIRGEHAPAVDVDVTFQGSSPHTRGARAAW